MTSFRPAGLSSGVTIRDGINPTFANSSSIAIENSAVPKKTKVGLLFFIVFNVYFSPSGFISLRSTAVSVNKMPLRWSVSC